MERKRSIIQITTKCEYLQATLIVDMQDGTMVLHILENELTLLEHIREIRLIVHKRLLLQHLQHQNHFT